MGEVKDIRGLGEVMMIVSWARPHRDTICHAVGAACSCTLSSMAESSPGTNLLKVQIVLHHDHNWGILCNYGGSLDFRVWAVV